VVQRSRKISSISATNWERQLPKAGRNFCSGCAEERVASPLALSAHYSAGLEIEESILFLKSATGLDRFWWETRALGSRLRHLDFRF